MSKVIIINSLIGSLFVYKMNILPRLPKLEIPEIETQIRTFLWKGGTPKIALKQLQSEKSKGGLKLFSLKEKKMRSKFNGLKFSLKIWRYDA